jgi:hypothetical protein
MNPMLQLKPHVKIEYLGMKQKLLILPGDRVGINFGTSSTPSEQFRMQADINSPSLPEPFRSRYRGRDINNLPTGMEQGRLPCNDVMIADSMTCQNLAIFCSSADDDFNFQVQGAGEIYRFNKKCSEFIPEFNFETETALLRSDV